MSCNRLTQIFNIGVIETTPIYNVGLIEGDVITCIQWASIFRRIFGDRQYTGESWYLSFSKVINESTSSDELISFQLHKPLDDATTNADIASFNVSKSLFSEISNSDAIVIRPTKVLAEIVGTSEDLQYRFSKALTGTATVSSDVFIESHKSITSNNAGASDEISSKTFTKKLTDSVNILDAATIGNVDIVSESDAVRAFEKVLKEIDKPSNVDTATAGETVALLIRSRFSGVVGRMTIGTNEIGI